MKVAFVVDLDDIDRLQRVVDEAADHHATLRDTAEQRRLLFLVARLQRARVTLEQQTVAAERRALAARQRKAAGLVAARQRKAAGLVAEPIAFADAWGPAAGGATTNTGPLEVDVPPADIRRNLPLDNRDEICLDSGMSNTTTARLAALQTARDALRQAIELIEEDRRLARRQQDLEIEAGQAWYRNTFGTTEPV